MDKYLYLLRSIDFVSKNCQQKLPGKKNVIYRIFFLKSDLNMQSSGIKAKNSHNAVIGSTVCWTTPGENLADGKYRPVW